MNEPILKSMYRVNGVCQMGLTNNVNIKPELSNTNSDIKSDFDMTTNGRLTNMNQNDRVTMKIDVSYTDHSHVIGKGGQSIKAIMTDTQCHIHFPDSNRTNTIEKSNQVSISGMTYGVELARQKIRAILPLIYSFDIPFTPFNVIEQQDRLLMSQLQRLLEVTISYRPIGKLLNGTTIFVKGIVQRARQTIKAVNLIISHHFGQNIDQVPVMMTIEIDPKHHSFLLNQGGQNSLVHEIFQLTRATINFPDNTFSSAHAVLAANNPMGISGLFKKSTVNIVGTAENTFEARQQLIGRLPVILMYDITIEEGVNLEMFNLNFINERFDVAISIKLKLKQCTKSVIIRTTERNVQALFEVKNILNKLRTQYKPIIQAGLKPLPPATAKAFNNTPNSDNKYQGINFGENGIPFSPVKIEKSIENEKPKPVNTFLHSNGNESPTKDSKSNGSLNQINLTLHHDNSAVGKSVCVPKLASFFTSHRNVNHSDHFIINQQNNNSKESQLFANISNLDSTGIQTSESNTVTNADSINLQQFGSINLNGSDWRAPGAEYSAKQRELKRSISDSPIRSLSESSRHYSEMAFMSIKDSEIFNEHHNYPLKSFPENGINAGNNNHSETNDENFKHIYFDSVLNRMNVDLDEKSLGVRDHHDNCNNGKSNSPNNICDGVMKILANLDLCRFADCFIKNEVDFDTFCSLNEEDLKELGVNTFGARRKIILAINDIISNSKQI